MSFFGEVSHRLKSKEQTNMEQQIIFILCVCTRVCEREREKTLKLGGINGKWIHILLKHVLGNNKHPMVYKTGHANLNKGIN